MINFKKILFACMVASYAGSFAPVCSAKAGDLWVGADLLKTNYGMKDRYGKNIFGTNRTAHNFFAGFNLTNNIYTEFGYESHHTKRLDVRADGSEYLPGVVDTITVFTRGAAFLDFATKFAIEQAYIGFGIYDYLASCNKFKISVLAGISFAKMSAVANNYFDDLGPVIPNSISQYNKNSALPIFKIGIDYQISYHFSTRITTTYIKMSDLEASFMAPNARYTIKYKNGLTAGLGILYKF